VNPIPEGNPVRRRELTAEEIVALLRLKAHAAEGGFFRETYRSPLSLPAGVLPEGFSGPRSLSTAIYYMLTPETFSLVHRLRWDEVWHFYLGDPVEMLLLGDTGRMFVLGDDLAAGMHVQTVVPSGVWQGARLVPGGRFALMGTTMAPGFEYAEYETGAREELLAAYPEHESMIRALTRPERGD
jgi:uncharacterized protein